MLPPPLPLHPTPPGPDERGDAGVGLGRAGGVGLKSVRLYSQLSKVV